MIIRLPCKCSGSRWHNDGPDSFRKVCRRRRQDVGLPTARLVDRIFISGTRRDAVRPSTAIAAEDCMRRTSSTHSPRQLSNARGGTSAARQARAQAHLSVRWAISTSHRPTETSVRTFIGSQLLNQSHVRKRRSPLVSPLRPLAHPSVIVSCVH